MAIRWQNKYCPTEFANRWIDCEYSWHTWYCMIEECVWTTLRFVFVWEVVMYTRGLWLSSLENSKGEMVLIQPYKGAIVGGGVVMQGVWLRFTDWKGVMKLKNRRVYKRDRGTGAAEDPQGTRWFRECGDIGGCRDVAWEVIRMIDGEKADHRKIDKLAATIAAMVGL